MIGTLSTVENGGYQVSDSNAAISRFYIVIRVFLWAGEAELFQSPKRHV
jgi:hypothetical protein